MFEALFEKLNKFDDKDGTVDRMRKAVKKRKFRSRAASREANKANKSRNKSTRPARKEARKELEARRDEMKARVTERMASAQERVDSVLSGLHSRLKKIARPKTKNRAADEVESKRDEFFKKRRG